MTPFVTIGSGPTLYHASIPAEIWHLDSCGGHQRHWAKNKQKQRNSVIQEVRMNPRHPVTPPEVRYDWTPKRY